MGIFRKKSIETKTFVDGQQQAGDPIPGLKIPDPEKQQEAEKPKEKEKPALETNTTGQNTIRIIPGYYYWLDEYGELCFKLKR